MNYLKVENLVKNISSKNNFLKIIEDVSFNVKKGELVTIFGPNGCGKTTLLKMILGIEKITSGSITIKKSVNEFKSYLVFQNPNDSLFNWMTLTENIKFVAKKKDVVKIDYLLKKIQVGGKTLFDFKKYYPYQLSGGLKQLAVLARSIIYNPELMLLDEPFSSLDYKTAIELEDLVLRIWQKSKQTVIFVSHNLDEAIYLADKIIVLSNSPTKVKKIIEVKLSKPRKQEIKLTKEFQEIKKQILGNLEDEIKY
jgi:NitT/TauT family transport system ATP-binding protein